ncbi:hypothetical protein [Pseudonocardia sp. WMMC193]|uniref:hypothetical protein n=1 Tax=Pseudonocardia sp. WMMC193 TaxID=2911965 RepID=UPI001F36ACF3|nr:hypothetical protein [Pseudonocardia sp. WMMC193]MCF7552212.1 hypothetical protein [Pseudonocardia sp. WMMC193]
MSREIDTTEPLSPEDAKYLADRDRTVEEETARQEKADQVADDVSEGRRPGAGPGYDGPAVIGYPIQKIRGS